MGRLKDGAAWCRKNGRGVGWIGEKEKKKRKEKKRKNEEKTPEKAALIIIVVAFSSVNTLS